MESLPCSQGVCNALHHHLVTAEQPLHRTWLPVSPTWHPRVMSLHFFPRMNRDRVFAAFHSTLVLTCSTDSCHQIVARQTWSRRKTVCSYRRQDSLPPDYRRHSCSLQRDQVRKNIPP